MTTWRPDHSDDPHLLFADAQVAGPVWLGVLDGVPVWLVSEYDDVRRLLADPGVSSDVRHAGPAARAVPWLQADNPHPLLRHMARRDPPEHTRLRGLVTKAFTSRRVEALRPRVQQIADQLIADILPAGRADLISDFALPLPLTVIADLLGVPNLNRMEFLSWAGICAGVDEGDLGRRQQALVHLTGYLDNLIVDKSAAHRASGAGDSSLLDGLIAARDKGDLLSHEELLATAFLLLVAGYETTAALIGNGMLALLRHPDQLAVLRADPAKVALAVEEFLRYDGPVKATPSVRFTTTDTGVAGMVIPAGEAVLPFLSAANRDPSRFPDPATLDIDRDATGHLGFGHGVHHCLGAPLARLEAQVAFTALLTSLDGLELGPGAPSWRHSYALHSLKSLPVTFTPRFRSVGSCPGDAPGRGA